MPTLIKRSNGIYYVILTDDHGRRKWISTGERKQSRALNKVDDIDSGKPVVKNKTSLQDFYHDFIAYAKVVFSAGSISIYERSFKKFIECTGEYRLQPSTNDTSIYSKQNASEKFARLQSTLNCERLRRPSTQQSAGKFLRRIRSKM